MQVSDTESKQIANTSSATAVMNRWNDSYVSRRHDNREARCACMRMSDQRDDQSTTCKKKRVEPNKTRNCKKSN